MDTKLPPPSFPKGMQLLQASLINEKRMKKHVLHQLFWECTLRCNLHCLHCGSDCRAIAETEDMPLEDFLAVLDDVRTVMDPGKITVQTVGGEPLVRKDLVECGRAIRERGFHWAMVSNGLLLDEEMCARLLDAGLESIAISMDGFAEDHNWIRDSKFSFAGAERAVKCLVGKKLTWDVITCVNKRNIGYLEDFKRYLIDLGVRKWRIFTIVPMGRAVNYPELQLSDEQFRELMDFIVKVRKENAIRLSYSCEGFLGEYEWQVRNAPFFCHAGVGVASILADGSISGCLSIRSQYHQGNIYKDRFTDVWENKFQQYREREWMHTGPCTDCNMWDFCLGNGMHLREDDGKMMLCRYK